MIFLKPDSYYLTFRWDENVYPLLNGHMGSVVVKVFKDKSLRTELLYGKRLQEGSL